MIGILITLLTISVYVKLTVQVSNYLYPLFNNGTLSVISVNLSIVQFPLRVPQLGILGKPSMGSMDTHIASNGNWEHTFL